MTGKHDGDGYRIFSRSRSGQDTCSGGESKAPESAPVRERKIRTVRITIKGGGRGGAALQSRIRTLKLSTTVSSLGGVALSLPKVINKCLLLFLWSGRKHLVSKKL